MTNLLTKTEIKYYLEGAVVPKARPRHNGKQSYLPQRYQQWKKDAIASNWCLT